VVVGLPICLGLLGSYFSGHYFIPNYSSFQSEMPRPRPTVEPWFAKHLHGAYRKKKAVSVAKYSYEPAIERV